MKQHHIVPSEPPPPDELDPMAAIPKFVQRSEEEIDAVTDTLTDIDNVLKQPPKRKQKATKPCCGTTMPCKRWKACYKCDTCRGSW